MKLNGTPQYWTMHVCLLSVCLFLCLSVRLSVCMSFCLFVRLSVCLSVCMSYCLFVCLSICPSVHLFVCLCLLLYWRNSTGQQFLRVKFYSWIGYECIIGVISIQSIFALSRAALWIFMWNCTLFFYIVVSVCMNNPQVLVNINAITNLLEFANSSTNVLKATALTKMTLYQKMVKG